MNICRFRIPCIAVLWTLSTTLMITALISSDDNDLARAAMFVGMIALIPTGWLIVEHVVRQERVVVVRQVCEAIGMAEAEGKLTRLR